MSLLPGDSTTLTVEWRAYAGGPYVTVSGVTIGITPVGGGTPTLAATTTGVLYPATGVNAYTWSIPGALTGGDYLITWTATTSVGGTVTATEVVTVLGVGAAGYDLYTDLATVKLALGKLTADDRDELILASIRTASRHIDNLTGRRFYLDASATARTFVVNAPPGTYFVRVIAVNAAGASAASNEVVLTPGPGISMLPLSSAARLRMTRGPVARFGMNV